METLADIKEEVEHNEGIKNMYPEAKVVFGYGSGSNGIMIIGEAPSRYGGNITGEPFTSPHSGALVQQILDENKIKKEECFVTNIVLCSPPENRMPTFLEAMQCLPYVRRMIAALTPKIVILLGKMPSEMLLSNYERDKIYEQEGIKYVAMYHPAYILRKGNSALVEYKSKFKEILK